MAVDGAGIGCQGRCSDENFAQLIRRIDGYHFGGGGAAAGHDDLRPCDASDSVQKVGALAEALHPTADGLQWDAAHIPAEWMHG